MKPTAQYIKGGTNYYRFLFSINVKRRPLCLENVYFEALNNRLSPIVFTFFFASSQIGRTRVKRAFDILTIFDSVIRWWEMALC